jgi:hypothetical protein
MSDNNHQDNAKIHKSNNGGYRPPTNLKPVPERPAPTKDDFGGYGSSHRPLPPGGKRDE